MHTIHYKHKLYSALMRYTLHNYTLYILYKLRYTYISILTSRHDSSVEADHPLFCEHLNKAVGG